MKSLQSSLALLCVLLISPWNALAEQNLAAGNGDAPAGLEAPPPSHWYTRLAQPYRWREVAPINVSNSSRLSQLLRDGNLYLSLQDAISLALENNIDIEIQRYSFDLADTDLFRARATGNIAGVPTIPSLEFSSIGATTFLNSSGSLVQGAAAYPGFNLLNNAPLGYDPVLTGLVQYAHQTTPEQNTIVTGTNSLTSNAATANFGVSQSFLTGTTGTLSFTNLSQDQNSLRNLINPFTTSSLDLQVTQHLLQGRSLATNRRPIRIAKNNQKVNDLVFEQQVIATVTNVIQLYWNLVNAIQSVGVAQSAVDASQRLLEDNQKQVDVGTLAPVELTRARAELASDRGNLITAQTVVLQQETVLKNALSRTGVVAELANAHIVPTDRMNIPANESERSLEELSQQAFVTRPEMKEVHLQIDSAKINLEGVRANLQPQVDAVADIRNNALTGSLYPQAPSAPPGVIVGGYGNALNQLFFRTYPNYSAGVSMTIPLRNRAAEANMATAEVNLRMTQQSVQRLQNLIRVDVQNALIALEQARIKHDTAVEQVTLEEELLDAENKKLTIGTSTPFLVIQVQRDLANAQLSEVQAVTAYALARAQLDQSVGNVLETNHIEIQEAKSGRVSRGTSPLPVTTFGGTAR